MTPRAPATVAIGPLEPVVRAALVAELSASFHVVELREARDVVAMVHGGDAAAAIVSRDFAAELPALPTRSLVLGVSSGSYDVLAMSFGELRHVQNPSPGQIVALIADASGGYADA